MLQNLFESLSFMPSPLQGSLECASLFVGIVAVAYLIDALVRLLKRTDTSPLVLRLLSFTAVSLAAVDCALLLFWAGDLAVHEVFARIA